MFMFPSPLLLLVSSTWPATPVRMGSPHLQGGPRPQKHVILLEPKTSWLLITLIVSLWQRKQIQSLPNLWPTLDCCHMTGGWKETRFVSHKFALTDYCLLRSSRDDDVTSDRSFGQVGERRRELTRSQTLPRNIGAQARRFVFERLDSEASNRYLLRSGDREMTASRFIKPLFSHAQSAHSGGL